MNLKYFWQTYIQTHMHINVHYHITECIIRRYSKSSVIQMNWQGLRASRLSNNLGQRSKRQP
jgi:hypothetical protein